MSWTGSFPSGILPIKLYTQYVMGAAGFEPASPDIELNDQFTAVRNNNSK